MVPTARSTSTARGHPAPPPAARSAAGASSRRPAKVVAVLAQPFPAVRAVLEAVPGMRARFLPDVPRPQRAVGSDLAVKVSVWGAGGNGRAFSQWAWDESVPALEIVLGPRTVLVGPLAIPGRVGCGTCARQRMAAASPAVLHSQPDEPSARPGDDLDAAGPVVAAELADLAGLIGRLPYLSRLVDHVLSVDCVTGESMLHKVIPTSRCDVCGGACGTVPRVPARRLTAADPPESLLAALAGWVDPLTGVVPSLVMEPDDVADLPVAITTTPPHVVGPDGSRRPRPVGWGKGLGLSGAILAAVGEALERYAACEPDPDRILWECLHDLHGDVLDPRRFPRYSPEQYARPTFPYARFDESVPHPWMIGTWLATGAPVWVPAALALLAPDLAGRRPLYQPTANGLAASTDRKDAALRATLELVERDAFMATWLTGSAGRRVAVDGALGPDLHRLIAAMEGFGTEVEIYLLPASACGTTALALGLGDGSTFPGVAVGLAADVDPHGAVRRALVELGQTGPFLARAMQEGLLAVPDRPEAVQHVVDHAAWFVPVERRRAFDKLRSGRTTTSLGDPAAPSEAPLRRCAVELAAAGVRVALVDVTSPDVATGPFTVVRALSPDLQPVTYGYGYDRLPVPRLSGRVSADLPPVHPTWGPVPHPRPSAGARCLAPA